MRYLLPFLILFTSCSNDPGPRMPECKYLLGTWKFKSAKYERCDKKVKGSKAIYLPGDLKNCKVGYQLPGRYKGCKATAKGTAIFYDDTAGKLDWHLATLMDCPGNLPEKEVDKWRAQFVLWKEKGRIYVKTVIARLSTIIHEVTFKGNEAKFVSYIDLGGNKVQRTTIVLGR